MRYTPTLLFLKGSELMIRLSFMQMHNVVGIIGLLVLGTSASPQAQAQMTLALTTAISAPYSTPQKTGLFDRLATEIFRRLGIAVAIHSLPAERALLTLNAGLDDGTMARVAGLAKRYANLVQFSEPLMASEFMVFTKRAHLQMTGWDSLQPYHIGIITGWKILEQHLTGVTALTKVKDRSQLFQLLDHDRVDVIIFLRWGGLEIIKRLGLTDVEALEPPLIVQDVFIYLYKKHTALAAQASAVLKDMKQDGTYQRIFDLTLGELMAK